MGETVSTVRNRVYPHKFDHDEARRLRREGLPVAQIARLLGVNDQAVRRVTDPREHARMRLNTWEYQQRGTCVDCGTSISYNPSQPVKRCTSCAGAERITSVREYELWCPSCSQWKPDVAFYHDNAERQRHRRYRKIHCRACDNAKRTAYRKRTGR